MLIERRQSLCCVVILNLDSWEIFVRSVYSNISLGSVGRIRLHNNNIYVETSTRNNMLNTIEICCTSH